MSDTPCCGCGKVPDYSIRPMCACPLDPTPENIAELTRQRDELSESLGRLGRTVKFQEESYLKAHGGSWGACKYMAQRDALREALGRAIRAMQQVDDDELEWVLRVMEDTKP